LQLPVGHLRGNGGQRPPRPRVEGNTALNPGAAETGTHTWSTKSQRVPIGTTNEDTLSLFYDTTRLTQMQ